VDPTRREMHLVTGQSPGKTCGMQSCLDLRAEVQMSTLIKFQRREGGRKGSKKKKTKEGK
jgi:hypothetical protein